MKSFELNVPQIIDGFTFIMRDSAETVENFDQILAQYTSSWSLLDDKKLLTDDDKEKIADLNKNFDHLIKRYLFVYDQDELVAWSFGIQESRATYYMINSTILPEYRRQGLYTRMMDIKVNHVKELGFQKIYSRHHANNNPVLLAKLKYGFVITGFEMFDMFGLLVQLSYFVKPKRFEAYAVRTGFKKLNRDLMNYLPISEE